jgi:hypothetical protein
MLVTLWLLVAVEEEPNYLQMLAVAVAVQVDIEQAQHLLTQLNHIQ